MTVFKHTINRHMITWDHEGGVCKLIRVPREKIDAGSDESDAWDLLWIEASTNVRRFEVRLDDAHGRAGTVQEWERDKIRNFLDSAPEEAAAILRPWA